MLTILSWDSVIILPPIAYSKVNTVLLKIMLILSFYLKKIISCKVIWSCACWLVREFGMQTTHFHCSYSIFLICKVLNLSWWHWVQWSVVLRNTRLCCLSAFCKAALTVPLLFGPYSGYCRETDSQTRLLYLPWSLLLVLEQRASVHTNHTKAYKFVLFFPFFCSPPLFFFFF